MVSRKTTQDAQQFKPLGWYSTVAENHTRFWNSSSTGPMNRVSNRICHQQLESMYTSACTLYVEANHFYSWQKWACDVSCHDPTRYGSRKWVHTVQSSGRNLSISNNVFVFIVNLTECRILSNTSVSYHLHSNNAQLIIPSLSFQNSLRFKVIKYH